MASLLACTSVLHCGGSTTGSGSSSGTGSGSGTSTGSTTRTGSGSSTSAQPEAGTDVGPCSADGTCPEGSTCGYLIGSCSATAECIEQGESTCNISRVFCGCGDAGAVYAGCSNYASAPTAGNQNCALPGMVIAVDAGDDAGFHQGPAPDGG